MVSADIAWASGEGGTWLCTADGGTTWRTGAIPGAEASDLRDVEGFDADTALLMAVGSPGRIWRTTDRGTSWSIVWEDAREGVFFDAMAFADGQRGYAFSDPVGGAFVVIRTADGGRTWAPVEGLPAPLDGEAGFAASGTCIAAREQEVWIGTGGATPRVLRSADGGRRWTAIRAPLLGGAPSRGVFSLAFRDAQNGVAVGGDYAEPAAAVRNAAFTADAGRGWHLAPGAAPSGYRSCVAFLHGAPSPTCFAVGPNGIDVSLDGGLSWSRVADDDYHAVAFAPDAPVGFAVGAGGRIARYDARLPLAEHERAATRDRHAR